MNRKYVIPIIATLCFAVGTVSILLPFLPLGWFLYAVTALLLIPYFSPFQKGFEWMAERDETGFTKKACDFTATIYRWAKDEKNAHLIEKMSSECADTQLGEDEFK
ncbi:hypothetical protein O3Q51_01435 [Cryomorphaceae bacterium 1068]|nr:hypothetical protein [Cryomorphaceae bacterium 1068]